MTAPNHPLSQATAQQVAQALQQATTKLKQAREEKFEPLAVIGLACRFPGADNLRGFWSLLREGRCAIGPTPRERFDGAALLASRDKEPGRITADRGGFVGQADRFDAAFFGISRKEALSLDPQHRLLMETIWEGLEHAAVNPDGTRGSRTGLFVGICSNDYLHLLSQRDRREIDPYLGTGNAHSTAAGRISYFMHWQGPSLAVDTACSSSLVAVHLAARALRNRDCDLAVAAGVNLILVPELSITLSQAGMLSPRGLCQAFAADADGFVRGEGCGVAVLKRLSQAVADGDRILAVIRGSAVNQDGRSNGLTAPNGLAQQQVIRSALADGNVAPQAVDYVEAHGTGTPLGDPIEMGAIGAVYGQQRTNRLAVGSVKTNVGHLEGAAGIAGFIKTCLALYHGQIPPHLHFERPSPHIDWSLPIDIAAAGQAWPRDEERPRLAGVSSFGFGGTNAHVVLEEAPSQVSACHGSVSRAPSVLVLSTKTATALKTLVARYQEHLADLPTESWPDVCATAATGRAALQHRLALVADDASQAQELLANYLADKTSSAVTQGAPASAPAVAWLFTGQGHSPFGAAQRWYETYAGFRQKLDQVADVLAAYWPRPVKQLLWEDGPWQQTTDVQPALFALQYAWAAWWQELGIQPQAVIGHSLGEYAAACLAGVFSLEDAVKLVTCRARLIGQLREPGGMLAVAASAEQIQPYLTDASELRVSLAAINGARQTVVGGADQGLNILATRLAAAGIGAKRLATTHAFHSPLLDEVLAAFEATAQTVHYQRPQLAYLSALLGDWDSEQVATPSYWRRQLREPVRFAAALNKLPEQAALWAEIGPGNVLSRLAKQQHATSTQPPTILSGWPDAASEETYLLTQLARLWTAGVPVDWQAFYGQQPRQVRRVTLPSYPFERKRYWFTASTIKAPKAEAFIAADAALPGRRLDLAGDSIVFETDLAAHGYLADHVVAGSAVFPAAGYLALALAAAVEAAPQQHLELIDVQFLRPLAFTPGESCRMQTVLTPSAHGTSYQVQFARREADRWRTYATAALKPADLQPPLNGASLPEPEGQPIDPAEHYRRCQRVGLAYGPAFQGVQRLVRIAGGAAWGQVTLPQSLNTDDETPANTLHPALLDACFQVAAAAFDSEGAGAWLPVAVNNLRHFKTPAADERLHVLAQLQPTDAPQQMQVHLAIATADGHTVATIQGLTVQQTAAPSQARAASTFGTVPEAAEPQVAPAWQPQPAMSPEQYVLAGPPETLAQRMLQYLSLRIVDVTDLRPEEIDADRPLDSLGLDSLMAFQLRDELLEKLRLDVPLEMFLQDLTLREMAARLAESLAASNTNDPQAMAEEAWVEGAL